MALIRFEQIDPARHMLTLQEELERFLRIPHSTLACQAKAPIRQ